MTTSFNRFIQMSECICIPAIRSRSFACTDMIRFRNKSIRSQPDESEINVNARPRRRSLLLILRRARPRAISALIPYVITVLRLAQNFAIRLIIRGRKKWNCRSLFPLQRAFSLQHSLTCCVSQLSLQIVWNWSLNMTQIKYAYF